jgi:hypothetical protein
MAASEKDYGGTVQGIVELAKAGKLPREKVPVVKPDADARFMEEQSPGRAIPDPIIRAIPKKFGQFSKGK